MKSTNSHYVTYSYYQMLKRLTGDNPPTCCYQHCKDVEIKEGQEVVSKIRRQRSGFKVYHKECWEKLWI